VGALPLLSYTLDDMWTQMVKVGDGVLRLPTQSFELGGVLVDRADMFLARHPGAEDALRRVLTLRLATVREGEEPTRRQARRSEFSEAEWLLVTELASHPNRLLATIAPESGETYAEVAHEAFGDYLIYSGIAAPFIDGRIDMYGDAFLRRYASVGEFPKLIAEYDMGWAVLTPSNAHVPLLDNLAGWRRIYADRNAIVYLRETGHAVR
jgi:hypothetical protein